MSFSEISYKLLDEFNQTWLQQMPTVSVEYGLVLVFKIISHLMGWSVTTTWMQKVKGQGHTTPKLDLEMQWRRHIRPLQQHLCTTFLLFFFCLAIDLIMYQRH